VPTPNHAVVIRELRFVQIQRGSYTFWVAHADDDNVKAQAPNIYATLCLLARVLPGLKAEIDIAGRN
jgi:hypothetical protein